MRRRWRSVVVLTLLVGFAGAVVLALVAGARRTDSSLARFERASRAADLEFDAGDATPRRARRVRAARPGVAAVGQLRQLTLVVDDGPVPRRPAAQVDDRSGGPSTGPGRRGTARHLDVADELTIGESSREQTARRVGDPLTLPHLQPADIEALSRRRGPPARGPARDLPHRRHRAPAARPRRPGRDGRRLVPTPAFLEQYRDAIGSLLGLGPAGAHRARRARRRRGLGRAARIFGKHRRVRRDQPRASRGRARSTRST